MCLTLSTINQITELFHLYCNDVAKLSTQMKITQIIFSNGVIVVSLVLIRKACLKQTQKIIISQLLTPG
jgi:hypothetical protein